ncbi:hypothetical protein [Novosphingobium sp. KN65.2]|uniref:hypothetical protein n=1 Tax=Novosphingobium sp. KN65.2 TaxID=1478134 RepID=UPI0005E8BDBA|nr:hypothetical protein [Novosphingobium sp. KN65.2]CDO34042.1 hypothetical protein SPHV1_100076 [Novosphingobium sp. KN65.2]
MFGADVRGPTRGMVAEYRRYAIQTFERAGVRTVETISRRGKSAIRQRMAGAGLGRLGNAIGSSSDTEVKRFGGDRFSVSAQFFARTRSERTLGALKAYTEGANITPVRSRWLWIPTDNIPRVSKRFRMTPALWRQNGFDKKIGPLVQIRSINGNPLLVVQNVGVALSGRKRSAKSLTRSGMPRKGQVAKEMIVAFIGIPRTARSARVNITEILNQVRAEMPAIFSSELAKERR